MTLKRASFFGFFIITLVATSALADLRKFQSLSPEPAPMDMVLKDLEGGDFNLSDYKGKVIVLNFWATWCMPCIAEMSSLNQLANLYKHDDFVVIAVAKDERGPIPHKEFRKRGKFYQMHFTLDAEKNGLFDQLKVEGLPTTLIIDQDGQIVGKLVGATDWVHEDMLGLMQKYIDRDPPPPAPVPFTEKVREKFDILRTMFNSFFGRKDSKSPEKVPPSPEKSTEESPPSDSSHKTPPSKEGK